MIASDIVDVALLAALIYAVLTRIDRSVSSGPALRMIGTTVLLLALVVAARNTDLHLVAAFLGGVVVVYVVAVLLVLQRDLRQMLDVVGTRLLRGKPSTPDAETVDTLTEAAFHLAKQRTGALIAWRGQESWEALVHDGLPLDGELSEPLLYSLFDCSTPGHDGAVLIDGCRVTRFAVHLPLAKGAHVSRFGGTRHAAALGLSQECDALILVVSEETGTIRLARHGQLTRIEDAATLKEQLEAFRQEHRGRRTAPVRPWRRVGRAVLAGSVAAVLWLLVAYSPDHVERTFEVPVAYHNVPQDWAVDAKPNHVQLTLRGPETAMASLSAEDLVVPFDLARPVEGTSNLSLREDQLTLPPRVELVDTQPAVLRVTATPLEEVELPVRVPTVGRLPDGLELERLEVEPPRLAMLVPAGREHPTGLISEVLDLSTIRASTTAERGVLLPPGARPSPKQAPTVRIRTTLRSSGGS